MGKKYKQLIVIQYDQADSEKNRPKLDYKCKYFQI